MFIFECWSVIRGKLSESIVDYASSLKEEVQVILKKMDGKDVDDTEAARKKLSVTIGERPSNAMFEEHEKIENVFSIRQSLSEVKEKIENFHKKEKDLKVLLEASDKEVEEAKLGVFTAEKDFDACNDATLLNVDDLTDLGKKKSLEPMCQDLINYKLCLD
ncbi:hypothetical protein HAX54_006085 [Datura stramonium]|uniref:Uncharacterized protein n=1 Tax=Datura stramonium TaxID=4076 RepID=A0ABS8T9Q2_DATST|nr:hypothetical protein [Datura stramonium]